MLTAKHSIRKTQNKNAKTRWRSTSSNSWKEYPPTCLNTFYEFQFSFYLAVSFLIGQFVILSNWHSKILNNVLRFPNLWFFEQENYIISGKLSNIMIIFQRIKFSCRFIYGRIFCIFKLLNTLLLNYRLTNEIFHHVGRKPLEITNHLLYKNSHGLLPIENQNIDQKFIRL